MVLRDVIRTTHRHIFISVIEINSLFLVTEKRNVIRITIEHNSKLSRNLQCIGWHFPLFEYLVPERCSCISEIWHLTCLFPPKTFLWIWPAGFLSQNNLLKMGYMFLNRQNSIVIEISFRFQGLDIIICSTLVLLSELFMTPANLDKSSSLRTPNHHKCASCI